jgi:hypothetical protein
MKPGTLEAILGASAALVLILACWNWQATKKRPLAGHDIPEDYTDQWQRFKRAVAKTPVKRPEANPHFNLLLAVGREELK